MATPDQALAPWHEFYALLGAASATMLGLQFVAASVGAGVFSQSRTAPLRMFLSATVVHFSSMLAISLIVLAPLHNPSLLGMLIFGCGAFGLGYYALTWRESLRDGFYVKIDREDRFWYGVLPVIGYLGVGAGAIALALAPARGGAVLAIAVGLLLLAAIHNAWDITVWSLTRRRE